MTTPHSNSDGQLASALLCRFLAALNQWQRNSWRRDRIDNYKFNNPHPLSVERTHEQLAQDWDDIAKQFISSDCRLYAEPPSVLSSPPVFDGADARPPRVVSVGDREAILEVVGGIATTYRFVLRRASASWSIQDILVPSDDGSEQWEQSDIL